MELQKELVNLLENNKCEMAKEVEELVSQDNQIKRQLEDNKRESDRKIFETNEDQIKCQKKLEKEMQELNKELMGYIQNIQEDVLQRTEKDRLQLKQLETDVQQKIKLFKGCQQYAI